MNVKILILCTSVLITGCNEENGMKAQGIQEMTDNMARNEKVPEAIFRRANPGDAEDQQTKRVLLENMIKEQEMLLADPELRKLIIEIQGEAKKF